MSNQIVISSGAKVRSLEGVLTGTAGIVNALGINVPSGIPQLDGSGKILVSQLPNSVMEYKGTWDAATNTPTLANGTGNQGDVYLCNVAGTVNFGAGPITFAVGDQVIYSGTIWQKAGGATGTVTSVALTESGDALTITGSPITTSGTINIGFAGTGLQYIKGDGTLATFPTTIDQAKRLITEVYNSTGATLTKGTVVYINGGQGNLPTITKAQANNDANSAQTYGVVQDDITNNNNGFVVVLGSLTDLDTSAYVVGTQLYLSGTTAGAWTSTKPSAPIHLVYVAIVVRSHPTQGVVEVRIQNGYELEEIHDVAISAPVNNQGIFYNSSNDLWENKSIATALGYTPANDALVVHLAGTETITGLKSFDAALNLKVGAGAGGTGYIGLGSITDNTLVVYNTTAGTTYSQSLAFPTGAGNTYTFPNLSGTIALLEGTQTFTGSKTFGGAVSFNFAGSSPIVNYGLALVKGNIPPVTSGAWSNIYASSGNNNLTIIDTNNTSVLQFQGSSSYTYTFPAATGTIALTSNLSSYVPYTGATGNVNLGTYSLTAAGVEANSFSAVGSGSQGGYIYLKQGSTPYAALGGSNGISAIGTKYLFIADAGSGNSKIGLFELGSLSNNTARTYTLPDASGTIALSSDLSSYVTLGTTQTITGSKTFSASVNNDDGLKIKLGSAANLTAGYLTMSAYGETSPLPDRTILRIGTSATQLTLFKLQNTGSYTYDFPASNGTLVLGTGTTNYLPKFTGASTLGDSLIFDNGTNVGIGTTTLGGRLDVRAGGTSAFTYYFRNSAGGYGGGIYNTGSNNTQLYLATSAGTENVVLSASGSSYFLGGNVGIGTSSPSRLLTVVSSSDGITAGISGATYGIRFDNGGSFSSGMSTIHGVDASLTGSYQPIMINGSDVRFGTSATERMRITSGGNVSIGSATDSGFRLYVKGTNGLYVDGGTSSSNSAFLINDNTGGTQYLRVRGDGYLFSTPSYNNTWPGSSANMYIASDGSFGRITASSLRFKENINEWNGKGLETILALKPKTFKYKKDYCDRADIELLGLIAEEVAEISPYLAEFENPDRTGQVENVRYDIIVVPLIAAIQELNQKLQDQQQTINSLINR